MPTTASTTQQQNTQPNTLWLKKEFAKRNITRMLVFCASFVLLQVASLVHYLFVMEPAFANYTLLHHFGAAVYPTLLVVALCVGIVLGVVFLVMKLGYLRSFDTQSFVTQLTLFVLTIMQLVVCALALNMTFASYGFLIYLLLLGTIPLLSRMQSTIYLLGFAVVCWLSSLWIVPEFLSPTLPGTYEAFASWGPLALVYSSGSVNDAGLIIVLIALLIISVGVSWTSYGVVKKQLSTTYELEQQQTQLEALIEERTAQYREEARAAEASNRAKTRFLTRVSHEMRTSMTTISGMAFLAQEATDETSRQESLAAISQASHKLKTVVDNILDTTKIESNFDEEDFDEDFALLSSDSSEAQPAVKHVAAPDLTGHTILIVEDLATNRLVLSEFLRDTHATVEEALNGKEAVEMFAASDPHYYSFIFMDLLMPEMNGHDATRAIRKLERADAMTIPIVAVSANAFKEDIEASLAAGMDAHLAKPIEQSTIFSTLIERLA